MLLLAAKKSIAAPWPTDVFLLQVLLSYDQTTGELIWKHRSRELFQDDRSYKTWNTRFAGTVASGKHSLGYLHLAIFGKKIKAHIICWALANGEWPKVLIDHINGDRADNRLCNLREADYSQNAMNKGLQSNNTSGCKGVSFYKGKWRVRINVYGKAIHIGRFDTYDEAVSNRNKAEEKYFGEFRYKESA